MSFKKINERHELSGFWNREVGSTVQGIVVKHVQKDDGPFFIFELTADCENIATRDDEIVTAKTGEYVGVMANATLSVLQEKYVGANVRITALEPVPSKTRTHKDERTGKKVPTLIRMYSIEVDEAE
jgi:hypothetical protein